MYGRVPGRFHPTAKFAAHLQIFVEAQAFTHQARDSIVRVRTGPHSCRTVWVLGETLDERVEVIIAYPNQIYRMERYRGYCAPSSTR